MVNKIKQYGSFLAGSVGVFALLYYGYSKGALPIIEGDWLFYAECMVIIPLCFMLAFKMLGRKYLKHQGSLGKIMIPLILILVVLMVTMAIYYDQMIKVTIQLFSISFFIIWGCTMLMFGIHKPATGIIIALIGIIIAMCVFFL